MGISAFFMFNEKVTFCMFHFSSWTRFHSLFLLPLVAFCSAPMLQHLHTSHTVTSSQYAQNALKKLHQHQYQWWQRILDPPSLFTTVQKDGPKSKSESHKCNSMEQRREIGVTRDFWVCLQSYEKWGGRDSLTFVMRIQIMVILRLFSGKMKSIAKSQAENSLSDHDDSSLRSLCFRSILAGDRDHLVQNPGDLTFVNVNFPYWDEYIKILANCIISALMLGHVQNVFLAIAHSPSGLQCSA